MTYPQSGGPPGEGSPGYAQPQDPWAGGFEPGQASVPTDPIPQQYDPYGGYPPADQWVPSTHTGYQLGYAPQPQRSRAIPIIITVVVVLLIGAGFGYGAYYFASKGSPGAGPTTPPAGHTTPPEPTTPPATTPAAKFDPHVLAVGDCVVNEGTPDEPAMKVVPCATAKSFKVIKIEQGTGIPEGANHKFDQGTTSVAVCKDTGYQSWYAYDDEDNDANDVFFCMTNNP